jgi:hypothetical protein
LTASLRFRILDRQIHFKDANVPELPQIVVPLFLYQATLCALAAALSWHALSFAQKLLKQRSKN